MADIWLPPKKQEPVPRTYGPLEVRDEDAREVIGSCFASILQAIPLHGIMATRPKELGVQQRASVEFLARQLLGDDFAWEELT